MLSAADLHKIQMITALVGYAVGKDGCVILKTTDNGNSWDLVTTYVYGGASADTILRDLRDLHFEEVSVGNYNGLRSR